MKASQFLYGYGSPLLDALSGSIIGMHYRGTLSGYIMKDALYQGPLFMVHFIAYFFCLFFLFLLFITRIACHPPRLYDIINLVGDIAQLGEHLLDV